MKEALTQYYKESVVNYLADEWEYDEWQNLLVRWSADKTDTRILPYILDYKSEFEWEISYLWYYAKRAIQKMDVYNDPQYSNHFYVEPYDRAEFLKTIVVPFESKLQTMLNEFEDQTGTCLNIVGDKEFKAELKRALSIYSSPL